METISPVLVDGVPVVVLLVALFWMLSTGMLVTRRENNATIADRNMWRETAQTLTPVVTKVLLESETTNRLLRALPEMEGKGE
jgi:hypothetical protein